MSAIGISSEKSGFRPRSELSEITLVAFLVHCQVRAGSRLSYNENRRAGYRFTNPADDAVAL
jgi:hypothetical protein